MNDIKKVKKVLEKANPYYIIKCYKKDAMKLCDCKNRKISKLVDRGFFMPIRNPYITFKLPTIEGYSLACNRFSGDGYKCNKTGEIICIWAKERRGLNKIWAFGKILFGAHDD